MQPHECASTEQTLFVQRGARWCPLRASRFKTSLGASALALAVALLLVGCSSGEPASSGSGGSTNPNNSGRGGVGGAGGAGGTATGSSGAGSSNQPGVVQGGKCYALCVTTQMGSGENPDYGFENNASCIIPNSPSSAAQMCTTGQPLPPPADLTPRPGVVLTGTCYPLCAKVSTPSDPKSPDWGYEDGASCVLPKTHTAVAQSCTTGQPLPDPKALDPRPGVVVLDGNTTRKCAALCIDATDPAKDPQHDDWDFEFGDSCVIPSSPTSHNQPCKTGEPVPPAPQVPGVVVKQGAGAAQCIPLCVLNNDPAKDPEGDDWAFENNSSCVIPTTAPAVTNLACTTGQPLPVQGPEPGVVVRNTAGVLTCVATCRFYKTATQDGANDDGAADDWAWENSDTCIIPGTLTAQNQACTTLQPIPAPTPRPGIMVNADPVTDSCKSSACVPLCRIVTKASDATNPDWGWEDNNSCVLPTSPTANVVPKSVENQGYAVPPRKCTWGQAVPDFLTVPALDATRKKHTGFLTNGTELRDAYDAPFVIRGVNNSDAWYDICGQYSAYNALTNIAAAGANAVRVGWAFKTIDPGGPGAGDPQKAVIGTNAQLLAEILHRIVELKMIPILSINDSTGQTDTSWPLTMAQLMTAADYKAVLLAYEPYLLLGIANEWNGAEGTTAFKDAYTPAIKYLRDNGINHTLVITANAWGQGCDAILNDGPTLLAGDPLHNLLFDMHIYTYLTYKAAHGGTAAIVQGCMDDIKAKNLPLLVGEFGVSHSSGPVAWQTVIDRANANKQGYTPWLWYGDTEYPVLNMNTQWDGPLTDWGKDCMPFTTTGTAGAPKVALKASVFP